MLDALSRAGRCREPADECRHVAALCGPTEMRNHYSRTANHYGTLAEAEELAHWPTATSHLARPNGGGSGAFPFPHRESRAPLLHLQESRIREPITMSFVRSALVVAAILGVVTSGVALAQTTTPSSSTSSKIDDVSKWTSKQWNRAKAEWEKEKEKWADCQKQSKDQNLNGRKSWSFLASCMTS